MTGRFDLQRIGLAVAAPIGAVVVAALLASVALIIAGHDPISVYQLMLDYGSTDESIVVTINKAIIYYLAGLAVAIGFKMKLFNIGVDGQYRLAALMAAGVGAAVALPAPLHVALIVIVAVTVGGLWAAIAAVLKVTRGVSEVISTIMLNFIAGQVITYLLAPDLLAEQREGSMLTETAPIPASGWVPGFEVAGGTIQGFVIVAVLVGVGYWVLLNKTRFGFDLRAAGASQSAAISSGVSVKRMVVWSMVLSGGMAGLIGLPLLLGETHTFGTDFPTGWGFTGIAVALIGRNHPVGVAIGALLWSYLDRSAQILDLEGVSREIVTIMQGLVVLAVVITYELARRYAVRQQARVVAAELGDLSVLPAPPSGNPPPNGEKAANGEKGADA